MLCTISCFSDSLELWWCHFMFLGIKWMTSLYPVRSNKFELFIYSHQLYIIFIVFFALHVGHFIFCVPVRGIFLFFLVHFLRFCQSLGIYFLSQFLIAFMHMVQLDMLETSWKILVRV